MRLDEPFQAEAVADLLVGGSDEDQVAASRASLRGPALASATALAATSPFMSSAPRPHTRRRQARRRTGRAPTRACVGEHHVGVRERARATARRRGRGCARRGSRAPGTRRRARIRRRPPPGRRGADRRAPSRSRADSSVSRRISSRSSPSLVAQRRRPVTSR